jgi:hypothetical protein
MDHVCLVAGSSNGFDSKFGGHNLLHLAQTLRGGRNGVSLTGGEALEKLENVTEHSLSSRLLSLSWAHSARQQLP